MRIWIIANLRICDLRTGTARNLRFAICGLINTNLRICDLQLPHLRNLRIFDCGMSPRICGFAICGLNKKNFVPTFDGYKVPCTVLCDKIGKTSYDETFQFFKVLSAMWY